MPTEQPLDPRVTSGVERPSFAVERVSEAVTPAADGWNSVCFAGEFEE